MRGDYVMLGYLDDPEATAEAIDADGWLHTGDIGVLDEQGNLRITDRLKDMYISGGFNVYPAEVEQALMRLDGVDDVAVVGVPDERMGEVGKAYVVGTADAEQVIAFAKERLANFKVPRDGGARRRPAAEPVRQGAQERAEEVMDLELSESELAFQAEARAWLEAQRAHRTVAVDGHRRGLGPPPGVGGEAHRGPLLRRVVAHATTTGARPRSSSG